MIDLFWLGIDRLVAKHVYRRYFPLHEVRLPKKVNLISRVSPLYQSLRDDVRNVNDDDLNDREVREFNHQSTMCEMIDG